MIRHTLLVQVMKELTTKLKPMGNGKRLAPILEKDLFGMQLTQKLCPEWPKEKEQRRLAALPTKAEWRLLKEGRHVRCSTTLSEHSVNIQ
jgi:hypothetical protein